MIIGISGSGSTLKVDVKKRIEDRIISQGLTFKPLSYFSVGISLVASITKTDRVSVAHDFFSKESMRTTVKSCMNNCNEQLVHDMNIQIDKHKDRYDVLFIDDCMDNRRPGSGVIINTGGADNDNRFVVADSECDVNLKLRLIK